MKTVFLILCHTFSPEIKTEYEKILRATARIGDCRLVFHVRDDNLALIPHEYDPYNVTDESLASLPYPRFRESSIEGSTHLPLLQFYNDFPEYDYYWRIEYDVHFSGDWRFFFETVSEWDEAFLSCQIRSYCSDPQWWSWEISHPTKKMDQSQLYASFNPIFRISRSALKTIDEEQRDGWRAHQEVLLATLLNHHHHELRDFGGNGKFVRPGDEGRFYIQDKKPEDCSVRWRPIFRQIPENSGKLYHPVREAGD